MDHGFTVGGIRVELVKRAVKTLHLTVHPPEGRVRIVAPERMPLDAIRSFTASKLPWIRRHVAELQAQERESRCEYVDQESHLLWGSRYLMKVEERDAPPAVELRLRELVLFIRPGTDRRRREEILWAWYRAQVHAAVAPLLARWQPILKVKARAVSVRRMKTKWGSCNPGKGTIRLNADLARKPPECLEYVLVHELAHFIVTGHDGSFKSLMSRHLPNWRQLRARLNHAPLAHEGWE